MVKTTADPGVLWSAVGPGTMGARVAARAREVRIHGGTNTAGMESVTFRGKYKYQMSTIIYHTIAQ